MPSTAVPDFKAKDLGQGKFLVSLPGKEPLEVVTRKVGSGYEFGINNGPTYPCHGHPVTDPQGVGIPPAAVVLAIRGAKSPWVTWANLWRFPPPVRRQSAW